MVWQERRDEGGMVWQRGDEGGMVWQRRDEGGMVWQREEMRVEWCGREER